MCAWNLGERLVTRNKHLRVKKKMLPDIFFTVHKLLSYALLLPRQNQFVSILRMETLSVRKVIEKFFI